MQESGPAAAGKQACMPDETPSFAKASAVAEATADKPEESLLSAPERKMVEVAGVESAFSHFLFSNSCVVTSLSLSCSDVTCPPVRILKKGPALVKLSTVYQSLFRCTRGAPRPSPTSHQPDISPSPLSLDAALQKKLADGSREYRESPTIDWTYAIAVLYMNP
jgi:hypothetical protein